MTKCSSCGRELKVIVPNDTKIYCMLCADNEKNELIPRKTLRVNAEKIIENYENDLNNELERFASISNHEYNFEKPYAQMGSQGRIDHLRNVLYWLKKNISQEQEDVVDSVE